eukprot:TRINITY_DN9325_c0_g1_i2.p1 TRINITY_DN9325_c0_g1~~TRINITY_DN9325_c0_g1_i2.p1  ORF type:complete len:527 (+),score=91.25 TRINITY_DN9325_c0_g1_i2:114-1694(+)
MGAMCRKPALAETNSNAPGGSRAGQPAAGGGGGNSGPGGDQAGGGCAEGTASSASPLHIFAAGQNNYGGCGVPRLADDDLTIHSPVAARGLQLPPGTEIEKIALGQLFVLVLTKRGTVLHAGANDEGQRGTGRTDHDQHPELHAVPLPCPAVDIACGGEHAAAALSSGQAFTWGSNLVRSPHTAIKSVSGQLGRLGPAATPMAADGISATEKVYAGRHSTFFLSRGGEVAACGINVWGELCLGDYEGIVKVPRRAAALCGRRILQLQAGREHCIMLEADGSVHIWGRVGWSREPQLVPIPLAVGPAVCVAAAGGNTARSFAVAAEGALQLWDPVCSTLPLPGGTKASAVIGGSQCTFACSAEGQWAAMGRPGLGVPFEEGEVPIDAMSELRIIADRVPHCVPLTGSCSLFALYLEGPGAEEIMRKSTGLVYASGILNVSGRVLWEEDLSRPLSDVGVSAECVVHLLRLPRLPPAAGVTGSVEGAALGVFVDATPFGKDDRICVEVHPEATVLDLVVAAAEQLGLRA